MNRVYFLRAGDLGPIKIGVTGWGIARRISALQIGCPWEIRLLGAVEGESRHERWLHRRFEAHRLRGEWFEATDELLAAIATILRPDFAWPGAEIPPEPVPAVSVGLLAALGGSAHVAAQLGLPYTTVHSWGQRNHIPQRHWSALIRAAREREVAGVTLETLHTLAEERAAS